MTRAAVILLTIGGGLFVALLAWQGFGSVVSTLMAAGWGLAVVAAFHLLPLVLDAGAISVMFDRRRKEVTELDAVFARWIGESVNSLLPAGQIGGPVMMVRQLSQRGLRMRDAAAAITVSTTLQALAQIVFAMLGLLLFGASAAHGAMHDLQTAALIATGVLAAMIVGFYMAQRRGLFGKALRVVSKVFGKRDWSALTTRADAVDAAGRQYPAGRGKLQAEHPVRMAA